MYAITNVAVRENYSTTSERLRTLSTGEEVHVTGKTEDGLWMRIEEGEGEAFVASNYLSTEKPVVEEESPATSESESTSSSGGSTDSSTTTPSTEAPVTEVPQQPVSYTHLIRQRKGRKPGPLFFSLIVKEEK